MNVAPVYYNLDNGQRPRFINLISATPSELNTMLAREELDISPVSSAAYARNQDHWLLLPDLSIACFGKVMSVLLVSRLPMERLAGKKVILTEESATAAALLNLLFALKKIHPRFETGKIKRPEEIQDDISAGLVIGDSALKEKWENHFDYVWDLGRMWQGLTGLPFVFALWAVRKSFAQKHPEAVAAMIEQFHISKQEGLNNMDQIVRMAVDKLHLSEDICRKYFLKLNYNLNPIQIRGLVTFFSELYNHGLISRPVHLSFFDQYQACYQNQAA